MFSFASDLVRDPEVFLVASVFPALFGDHGFIGARIFVLSVSALGTARQAGAHRGLRFRGERQSDIAIGALDRRHRGLHEIAVLNVRSGALGAIKPVSVQSMTLSQSRALWSATAKSSPAPLP